MLNEQEERTVSDGKSENKDTEESREEQINSSQNVTEEKKPAEEDESADDSMEKISEYAREQSDKANIYIQYRIYNNHGVMAGDDAQFESIHVSNGTSGPKSWMGSVFKDKDGLCRWLADYYASYAMALMVAAAAFDSLPYTWVIGAAKRFYESFEHSEETDNVYAQEEILQQFGAEICKGEMNTYIGITSIDIVHFTDAQYRETILRYIWRQYPQLQQNIISWLQSYNMHRPLTMSKRALEVMGFLAGEDFLYFLHEVVPQISVNKNISTDMMVGQILILLNQREEHKKNVYNLLRVWSREERIHNMLTALFVCAQLNDKNDILRDVVENYIQGTLREIQEKVSLKYRSGLYDFMGAGIRSFTFYRMLIETLEEAVNKQVSQRQRWNLFGLFLRLFAIDVSQARPRKGEEVILIMLCTVRHTVSDKLCLLWRLVWECGHYRQLFYDLMARYDAKIAGTDSRYSVERFVDKVLEVYPEEKKQDICSKIHRRARDA